MLKQIAGEHKINYPFFDKIKIHYISHHPLDWWIYVCEETFPGIYSDPATSDYIIYKVSVATAKIKDTVAW